MSREADKSFAADYAGPAAFYSLLHERQRVSPLFLRRLTRAKARRKRPRKLAIDILDTSPRLIVLGIATLQEDRVCNVGECVDLTTSSDASVRVVLDLPAIDTSDQLTVLVVVRRVQESPLTQRKLIIAECLSSFLGLKETSKSVHQTAVIELPNCYRRIIPSAHLPQRGSMSFICPDRGTKTGDQRRKIRRHSVALSPFNAKASGETIDISLSYMHAREAVENDQAAEDVDESKGPAVYMHYCHKGGSSWVRRKHQTLACPWCPFHPGPTVLSVPSKDQLMQYEVIDSVSKGGKRQASAVTSDLPSMTARVLINHLKNCHEHFLYEFCSDHAGNFHVIVRRDRSLDYDSSSLIRELRAPYMYHSFGKSKQSLYDFAIPMIKVKRVEADEAMSAQSNCLACASTAAMVNRVNESSSSSMDASSDIIIKEPKRVYYHASVGLPLFPHEEEVDSDDGIDASTQAVSENVLLEEYADMSFEEKEFMSLWRNHVTSFPAYADMYVALACERFAAKHAP